MKKNLSIPPKPTKDDMQIELQSFYMVDWQFKKVFKSCCTHIETEHKYIGEATLKFEIYGLKAAFADSKEDTIGNFFLRYGPTVYQRQSLSGIYEIIETIVKNEEWDQYTLKKEQSKKAA